MHRGRIGRRKALLKGFFEALVEIAALGGLIVWFRLILFGLVSSGHGCIPCREKSVPLVIL
jgi:hypothetical protein